MFTHVNVDVDVDDYPIYNHDDFDDYHIYNHDDYEDYHIYNHNDYEDHHIYNHDDVDLSPRNVSVHSEAACPWLLSTVT